MSKGDFVTGTSTVEGYFGWINERTAIWHRRFVLNQPKPWTDDPILQRFKFTNGFRQLDRGTIALNKMIKNACEDYRALDLTDPDDPARPDMMNRCAKLLVWNIMWYRLFNLDVHAVDVGYLGEYFDKDVNPLPKLHKLMREKADRGEQIFTGSHMTTGVAGEDKVETYLRAATEAWDDCQVVVDSCREVGTLHSAFETLKQFYMVGPFVAYEMACDLRFTPLLDKAPDKLSWSNIGPGARRGMRRLGMEESIRSMVWLWHQAVGKCPTTGNDYVIDNGEHVPVEPMLSSLCLDEKIIGWPFELREVEHSLCEFDKMERVRLGEGRPRQKYNGV